MSEPIMTDLTVDYYASLRDGRLTVQLCHACGSHIMYPRYRCPGCFSSDLGWTDVIGKGVLHSFTVLLIGSPSGYEEDLPYAIGVVKLEEGVQLLGRLWPADDGTWDHYRCDGLVEFRSGTPDELAKHPAAWFQDAATPA
jgi:uncharacterized protein